MAFLNNFNGITFDNQTLTAEYDAYLQNSKRKDNGIVVDVGNELSFTLLANEVTVNSGLLIEQGRAIRNDTSTIDITLAAGANEFGYVLVKIDLSQAPGSQVGFVTKQQVGSLPTLQQDDLKANPSTGIVEIPILSYEVSTSSVLSTTDLRVILQDGEEANTSKLIAAAIIEDDPINIGQLQVRYFNDDGDISIIDNLASVTSIVFDNTLLDINRDGGIYDISGYIKVDSAAFRTLSIIPNAFVNTDFYFGRLNNTTLDRSNGSEITETKDFTSFKGEIFLGNSSDFNYIGNSYKRESSSILSILSGICVMSKTVTMSNITQLTFTCSAAVLDVGTEIKIYKK